MNSELQQLRRFFEAQGVDARRAEVMAGQVRKRADQLAAERGISRIEAVEHLLKVVIHGSRGEAYRGSVPTNADSERTGTGEPHKQGD